MKARQLIEKLELLPHPEGGWYRETYRSAETITNKNGAKRNVCTAIYFLLEGKNKSHFHRIESDETWFFHSGETLEILMIYENQLKTIRLGNNILKGEIPQFTVPSKTWFAARIETGTGYSLVSCTVAPGFDFADFELAEQEKLSNDFPELKDVIREFTIG
ncbi:MAG: cupin domain-containing protein [Draconibacterium sp.]